MGKARIMGTNNRSMVSDKMQYFTVEQEMLLGAGIDPEKEIVVECREGKIIVRQKDDYDRLLEVLPKVFCLLDIPAEIVTAVLWEIKGLAGRYETEF